MRDFFRVVSAGGFAAVVAFGHLDLAAAQTTDGAQSQVEQEFSPPAQFAGVWDYNASESINIATGRPEQSPRSAIQRGAPARTAPVAPSTGRSTSDGRGSERGSMLTGFAPTPQMMREARDMARDLLEVPEALTIVLGENSISFTDDIDRERVYPTNGRRQKYLLGASQFNARLEWNGAHLRKEIEGSFGFRMTETYFLSPDGQRLFVIIRVGTPGRNRQLTGFNRVYDRVDSRLPVAGEQEERISSR